MTGQSTARVALVTIAHGRHVHLSAQVQRLARSTRRPDRHIVVAMGDDRIGPLLTGQPTTDVVGMGADPGALPLAAARNLGAQVALDGGADTLIFLDVDCLPGPHLVDRYAKVTGSAEPAGDRPQLWSGPVHYLPTLATGRSAYDDTDLNASQPHRARPAPADGQLLVEPRHELFWSLSFALSAADWRRLGGFCDDYVGYGAEDTDFARTAAAAGATLTWVGGATAYHQHHPTSSPPIQHLADIVRNANLFHTRWGDFPMLGWLRQFQGADLVALDPHTGGWVVTDKGRETAGGIPIVGPDAGPA